MSKLNEAYREVMKKELSWLPSLIPAAADEFNFQVVDLDTLSLQFNGWYQGETWKSILLIDCAGHVIGRVGERTVRPLPTSFTRLSDILGRRGRTSHKKYFRETVEEALARLNPEALKTQYILHICSRTVLYKVPKGTTIEDHLENKKNVARKELMGFVERA